MNFPHIPIFTGLVKRLTNSFGAKAADEGTSPIYISPGMGDDKAYTNAVEFIKTNLKDDAGRSLKTDLENKNMVLELSAKDWADIYLEKQFLNLQHGVCFNIASGTIKEMDFESFNKVILKTFAMLEKNTNTSFSLEAFVHFIAKAAEEGQINLKKRAWVQTGDKLSLEEVMEKNEKAMSVAQRIYNNGCSSFYPSIAKLGHALKNIMEQNLARQASDIGKQLERAALAPKPQVDKKESITPETQLLEKIVEIQTKSGALEEDLKLSANEILDKAKIILYYGLDKLSAQERVKFSGAIDKDLPDLIFNYLSIPLGMRETLIVNDSTLNLKEDLKQSFNCILMDFNLMDKANLADTSAQNFHEQAALKIQATAKYLKSRN